MAAPTDANGELRERLGRLETHQQYAATREDVLRGITGLEKVVTAVKSDVDSIRGQMATKNWILGSTLSLVVLFLVTFFGRALATFIGQLVN